MRFYKHNRLDEAFERDAGEVVEEFVEAVKAGYDPLTRGVEFGIKWWMSDSQAFACTWEEDDFEKEMVPALRQFAAECSEDRELLLERCYG